MIHAQWVFLTSLCTDAAALRDFLSVIVYMLGDLNEIAHIDRRRTFPRPARAAQLSMSA
jgi:hypothetical protein